MDPQPKSVNNFLGKIILIFVKEPFDGCVNDTYTGVVVDILSQGVTIHPLPGENEVTDHIPWSNIRSIRHTVHLETDPVAMSADCVADISVGEVSHGGE